MKRYTISNRSKNCHGSRIGYYNYYSSLSDEATINDTNIHTVVFDEYWNYRCTIINRIRILSRYNKFRNRINNRIKLGLRGLYNRGKI